MNAADLSAMIDALETAAVAFGKAEPGSEEENECGLTYAAQRQNVYAEIEIFGHQRRQLAKHCVVVITKPVHPGDSVREMWCTVCQVRLELSWSGPSEEFIHKPECLVAKVEAEA